MSYRYDIFISYTRDGEAGDWVRNHFQPKLDKWLRETMPAVPSVFWDRDIESGEHWPTSLKDALARSRILVPVWTHPYFRSHWCLSELNTMIARAQLLAQIGIDPQQLIKPVRFYGEGFPEQVIGLQYEDMSAWAYSEPVFAQSLAYLQFNDAVRDFAARLAGVLPAAPTWDPDWPTRISDPAPLQEVPLVRL